MSLIASASTDLRFHTWQDGTLIHQYPSSNNSNGFIKTISWAKGGTWLVFISHSGFTEIVSIKDNVRGVHRVKDIQQPTSAIFPRTTKKFIALGTYSGQVLLYDIKSRSVRKRFPRATSWIQKIDCNANDTHLASATSAGDILLYNMTTSNLSATYAIPSCRSATCLSFHRTKRNLLAAGSGEGIVAVWDINNNERKATFHAHGAPVNDVALSPIRSELVATVGSDRQFTFYDIQNKKCVVQMEVPNSMLTIDFSLCGLYVGMGSQNGHIVIYDMRNLAKPLSAFSAHDGRKITQVSFQRAFNSTEEESSSMLTEENVDANPEMVGDTQSSPVNSPFNFNQDLMDFKNDTKEIQMERNVGDSFQISLGSIDYSVVTNSLQPINVSFQKEAELPENKPQLFVKDANKKTPASINKKKASTPNHLLVQDLPSVTESPIISPIVTSTDLSDVKKILSEIVREELNNLKTDMRHEFMDSMAQMRRQFLDLQMFLVKEFINVENTVCKVSGVTVEEYLGDSNIMKENNRLKQEIELLKKKIVNQDTPDDSN